MVGIKSKMTSIGSVVKMERILLKVYLQPKASKNEIVGPYRDGIKVRITAPPIEGKANKSLIQFLSKELGIPPSQVEIIKGQRAREKTLSISGIKNCVGLLNSSKCLDFKGKID
jgi:uncharacterized protein (TIGR00251 family)